MFNYLKSFVITPCKSAPNIPSEPLPNSNHTAETTSNIPAEPLLCELLANPDHAKDLEQIIADTESDTPECLSYNYSTCDDSENSVSYEILSDSEDHGNYSEDHGNYSEDHGNYSEDHGNYSDDHESDGYDTIANNDIILTKHHSSTI
jgi:hypothetical protein